VAWEKLSDLEILWNEFNREELRLHATQGIHTKSEEEENVALHVNKGSGPRGSKDMGKVR